MARVRDAVSKATTPMAGLFASASGRTLLQVGMHPRAIIGPRVDLTNTIFTPGHNQVSFTVTDKSGLVYAPAAVYVASGLGSRASGPYPAPADLLVSEPGVRSRQGVKEGSAASMVYEADVPLPRSGAFTLLIVLRLAKTTFGDVKQIAVDPRPEIPDVGERAPRVRTETVASARGKIAAIDSRTPHDEMHGTDLRSVLGRRPVALLFASPRYCRELPCGAAVDMAAELQHVYGRRISFIHQELYRRGAPSSGLADAVRRYGLPTELWLFTIDRSGRIAVRLQGKFGFAAFKRAVVAALRDRGP